MKKAVILILCILSIGILIVGCSRETTKVTTKATNQTKKVQDAGLKSEAENTNQKDDQSKVKKKAMRYVGIIQAVDLKSKTMTAGKEDLNVSYLLDISQAKLNGYQDLKDLKIGDKVTIDYDVKLGKVIAKTISKR